jgi:hypothetical protein
MRYGLQTLVMFPIHTYRLPAVRAPLVAGIEGSRLVHHVDRRRSGKTHDVIRRQETMLPVCRFSRPARPFDTFIRAEADTNCRRKVEPMGGAERAPTLDVGPRRRMAEGHGGANVGSGKGWVNFLYSPWRST